MRVSAMRQGATALAMLACALGGCTSPGESFGWGRMAADTMGESEIAIRAVLAAQAAAWNRGDIDGFMQGYWNSPELRFLSGGQVTRGWQATRDRYDARYGTSPQTMGRLSFSRLDVAGLSHNAAVVYGAWQLERETDAPHGLFTLVFRKVGGAWVIVSDTTTAAP